MSTVSGLADPVKSSYEAADLSRTEITAHHTSAVYDHVCPYGTVIIGIVGHNIGIASYRFALVSTQIKPLLLLKPVVVQENAVKLGWNAHLHLFNGDTLHRPAELGEEGDAILIGLSQIEADGADRGIEGRCRRRFNGGDQCDQRDQCGKREGKNTEESNG